MRYGYARVSEGVGWEQPSLARQVAALEAHGCDEVVSETCAGCGDGLLGLMGRLVAGDELAIYRFDRLADAASEAIGALNMLRKRGVTLVSLDCAPFEVAPNSYDLMKVVCAGFGIVEFVRSSEFWGGDAA